METKLKRFGLKRKFEKQMTFLKANPRHPSLNLELLEPKTEEYTVLGLIDNSARY